MRAFYDHSGGSGYVVFLFFFALSILLLKLRISQVV